MRNLFTLFGIIICLQGFGQTGPGGIGNATGTSGQPENIIWLDANTIGVADGADVVTWTDISGNGEVFAASSSGSLPSFSLNQVNGLPSVVFDDTNAERLNLNPFANMATTEITTIVVFATANSAEGVISYAVSGQSNEYLIFDAGNIRTFVDGPNSGTGSLDDGINTFNIFTSSWRSSDGSLNQFKNGASISSTTLSSGASITTGGSITIGGEQDAVDGGYATNQDLNGEIAEIIMFKNAINDAQRIIIENYLSEKFNITITNDFFSLGDASFNNDLVGIGTSDGTNTSSLSGFSDALQIEEAGGTLNSTNEFILMAHDGTSHSQTSTSNISDPDITDRWARSWFLEVAGGVSAELRFDFGTAGLGAVGSASDYVLLYRAGTGDDFTRVLANSISIENGDQVVVNLSNQDLPTGYYTLGRGTQLVNITYYSFQSGNWEDALTWTTDPSGALRVPVTGNLPTAGDNMVILSGRTVRMATDDNDGISLTVDGRLDIENTTGHNYFSIAGSGIISVEGFGGSDNFPTGSTSDFADPIVGGTVSIEAGNFDLDANRLYNNVVIDLASATNTVTLLSDYTINGDLTIQTGILEINDNTATNNLNIDVFGNVQVDASAEINVGTANARHQFNFYGDFTNNGRVEFTNRTIATVNSEAINGIVDANFLDDDADQAIDCNGVTNFYRIEIDKGVDQTYILDVNALSAANFNLFGFANQAHSATAQLTDNANALGLIRGTVRLNTNVDVDVLNNGGNYNLSEGARLWVNGGSVTTNGNSIVPYGTIQVSDGFVIAPGTAGITTRDNGTIIVEGGTVTTNQIRTSVLGADNIGGYFQSGGTVNVTGGSIGTNYYTFSLTYPGNTFNMSGGVLNVSGSQPFQDNTGSTSGQIHGGGIFIDSDPGNISVTGGTVIMENTTATPFKVTSKAPFWNVIMRFTSGSATEVDLDAGTSGDNQLGDFETITNPELIVLNDLTIEDGVVFDHNGFDVEIGSDFTIQSTGDYLYDAGKPNTTTINGVDDATLTFLNRTGDASDEQVFWNLIIEKPTDRTVSLASGKADLSGSLNNLINVAGDAFKVLSGTLDNGEHSIRVFSDSLVNYDILGVYDPANNASNGNNDFIKLTDQPITLITADSSRFGNVRFNNSNDIVELTSDVFIERFQYRFGRMNLGVHKLTINALNINLRADQTDWNGCGGCFSVEDMFITSGNGSDGGLSLYVPADGLDPDDGDAVFDFPFGIGIDGLDAFVDTGSGTGNSKYTPASATLSGVTDDGYITIRPVDDILPTTDPTGGDILSYYWKVDFEQFTTPPTVEYNFTYYDNDLDGSVNESTFAAGKVLEEAPFTRSYEDDPVVEGVDDTNNIITFNGPTDTGFTLESASYTAGEFGRFVGAPEIYFSRQDGNWNLTNRWSTVSHTSAVNTGTFPQAGDVAIIGFDGTDFHRMNAVGDVDVAILEFNSIPTATAKTIDLSRVLFGTNEDLNAEIVRGVGELQFASNNGNGPGTINAGSDLGDFVENKRSSFIYTLGGTGDITIPTIPRYPSLRFFANGANDSSPKTERFFLDADIECSNLLLDGNSILEVTTNIVVEDTLFIGANRDGELIFNNGTVSNTVETDYVIFGSDLFGAAREENVNRIFVESGGGNGVEHRLIVNEDIIITTGSSGAFPDNGADFDLFTNVSDNNVILELRGNGNNTFTIEGDDDIGSNGIQFIPEFYRIVVNKGNSVSSSFSFNDGFTLQGSTSGATKALTLQNGLLVLNSDDNDINIDLSTGGGDFDIPGSSGLQVTQAQVNVSGDDTGIILDGQLIIDGGVVNMDDAVGNGNNFIEYSASGNALLQISSGTLDVGSQIRGITSAETGVLRYRQTGGDVRIGTQAGPENTRGMLQVYNTGSEFTYTGGTLTIERHQSSPSVAALFLDPDDSDVTGSTITIFNGNTPVGQSDFRINSVIALENLTINGTNSPSAIIDINALTISETLTIESGATLNGNARTLTVGGDFDNDGTYNAQSNETIFNSTGSQQITGTGSNNFFRFTKSETGTLDLTSAIDVADLFTVNAGTLSDNGNSINLAADAVIDGTHSSTGGNGLVFAGGSAQELRRSSAGTGTLGVLSINNASGVTIPDGNGFNFNIDGGLRLENGVFNVGGSEILLGISAEIEEVNTFGVSNMIRTNSSFTDGGVGKVFAAAYSQDFTFPIGQTFFTPVEFDFGTPGNTFGSTSGTITVFPADEFHPTIDDGADFFITGDTDNVLQYYWTITASGITGLTAQMTTSYDDAQVLTDEPGFDETDYIAARILTFDNPTDEINKFTTAEVNETTNVISFVFAGVADNGITGDYFAGIDEAIPDNVATYTVDTDGNFGDDVYDIAVPGGGAPTGAVVIIPNTFTLTLDADNASFYRTEIQDGGVLEVDNSTNHRLGQLSGTGTLRVLSDGINANLPAFSGDFLSCTGGGLEYGGSGSYSVLSGITELRSLSFIGSGDRNFPNNNVTVCQDLIIDGPTVAVLSNRRLFVDGRAQMNSGVLNAPSGGSGRFNVFGNDFTVSGGTFNGGSSGQANIINDLIISGGVFNAGTSSYNIRIGGDLSFTSGTFNSGSSNATVSMVIFSSNQVSSTINGGFVGSNAFNNLSIQKGSSGLVVNLQSNIEISGILRLDNGLVVGGTNDVLLGSSSSVIPNEGRVNSYVVGAVGKVLSAVGNSFNFPIGSASRWRPASINNVSAGGLTWEAEYFEANPTTEALVDNLDPTDPVQIETVSDNEYWKISDGNAGVSGVTATIGLSWGTESVVSSVFAEREELEVMIWNDGLSSWDNLDGTGFSSGHTQNEGRFTSGSSNSFSERIFTLGSATVANALPIELQKFNGETVDGNNHLEWVTASELNNDYFELQRSTNGVDYVTLGRIEGQGTSTESFTYNYVDNNPVSGLNYYRLKQVDIDGTVTVFNRPEFIVVLTVVSQVEFDISAYPNPTVQTNMNLKISSDQNLPLVVRIVDLHGKVVYFREFEPGEIDGDIRINPNQRLKQGMYTIIADQQGKSLTRRVIITE